MSLAALTLAGYLYTFAYEIGYVGRYSIPIWVIRVDLMHVIGVTAISGVAVLVFTVLLQSLPPRPYGVLLYHVWRPALYVAAGTWTLWQTQWSWGWHLLIGLVFAVLWFLLAIIAFLQGVIFPLQLYRDQPTVWDRWRERIRYEAREGPISAFEGALTSGTGARYWRLIASAILIGGCGPILLLNVGRLRSTLQVSYSIYEGKPPCIALREYGDRILCIEVDTAQRRTLGTFRLLPVTSDSARFALRVLGRLATEPDSVKRMKLFAPLPKKPTTLKGNP